MNNRELYIKAKSEDGWLRPTDWLPMPTGITESDQIFVGLHAVIENSDNFVAFRFTTSTGQYQVDWGDGTVTLHNSNTIAQYQYDYATISNSTLTSKGYKQAMITVTAVSGNLLTCSFQIRYVTTPSQNQSYSTGFLDIIFSMPNASTGQSITLGGVTVRHSYCERVEIKTIGGATNLDLLFTNFLTLQSVNLFNTQNVTDMLSIFNTCRSLKNIPLFNTQNVTNMTSMFANCSKLQNIPLFNTQNVTNMSSMFGLCFSLQSVPLLNTQNVNNMSFMFNNCFSLNYIPPLSTQSITTTLGTDFGASFATTCNSLNRCEMVFARTVAFNNCQLSRDALVEIFTNLVDRSATTSANINITGNWGATALSTDDRNIATNKNWVITG